MPIDYHEEDIVRSSGRQEFGGAKIQRAHGNIDYDGFSELLVKLGKLVMPDTLITQDSPRPNVGTPTITFEIVHKAPIPQEPKPRIRQTYHNYICLGRDEDRCVRPLCSNFNDFVKTCFQNLYPKESTRFEPIGDAITVWAQRFNTIVQFNCWGRTVPEANRLISRFELLMVQYAGVFKYHGVSDLLYQERLKDMTITAWRNDIVSRSVRYRMIFESQWVVQEGIIQKITFKLDEPVSAPLSSSDVLGIVSILGT